MIIKRFEQWRADKLRVLAAVDPDEAGAQSEVEVDCPVCNGRGVVECDCGCPNCDADLDCWRCDGMCAVSSLSLGEGEADGILFTATDYLREMTAELVAWARYEGKPPLATLIEAGTAPHSRLPSSPRDLIRPEIVLRDPQGLGAIYHVDLNESRLQ